MGVVNLEVKITSGEISYWYNDQIGDIITVDFEEVMPNGKKVYRIGGQGGRGIFADDCIVLTSLSQYPTLSKQYTEKQ